MVDLARAGEQHDATDRAVPEQLLHRLGPDALGRAHHRHVPRPPGRPTTARPGGRRARHLRCGCRRRRRRSGSRSRRGERERRATGVPTAGLAEQDQHDAEDGGAAISGEPEPGLPTASFEPERRDQERRLRLAFGRREPGERNLGQAAISSETISASCMQAGQPRVLRRRRTPAPREARRRGRTAPGPGRPCRRGQTRGAPLRSSSGKAPNARNRAWSVGARARARDRAARRARR